MFYTATMPQGPSTLCERCALLALNMAAFGFVRRPYGSMEEGLDDLNRRCDENNVERLAIRPSRVGVCGHCGEDVLEAS